MNFIIRLRAESIDGGNVCCLGSQLFQIVGQLRTHFGDLTWYAADVEIVGQSKLPKGTTPQLVGKSSQFLAAIQTVDQFLRGVFLGVAPEKSCPRFREFIDTEDPAEVDLSDASVEIRAFDTTFFEILTKDARIATVLEGAFGVSVISEESRPTQRTA